MSMFQKAVKPLSRTASAGVLALAGLTASAGEAEAKTVLQFLTASGNCYQGETSIYTGANKYQVGKKVRSVNVKQANMGLSGSKKRAAQAEHEASMQKGFAGATYRAIARDKVVPHAFRQLEKGPLKDLVNSPNVEAAKVVMSGNKGQGSVYENVQGKETKIAGNAAKFAQACRGKFKKITLGMRPDGNKFDRFGGTGKNWSPALNAK